MSYQNSEWWWSKDVICNRRQKVAFLLKSLDLGHCVFKHNSRINTLTQSFKMVLKCFAFEITKSVWKLTCSLCKWQGWQFHGEKKRSSLVGNQRMSRIWKSICIISHEMNPLSIIILGKRTHIRRWDDGKIIHVESIWGQFHVRKTECPASLILLSLRSAEAGLISPCFEK